MVMPPLGIWGLRVVRNVETAVISHALAPLWRGLAMASVAVAMAACASAPVIPPPSELPLSKDAMMLLGKKGMSAESPIHIRIFKEDSELEVWKQRDDGRFYHFKTYPICNWSGELGPKVKQGDKQAPEGFYTIAPEQLNPKSSYHLAFNMGFPNAYDRAHNRTGDFLMIHGKCKSAGCYAMTDALIEEIYALGRDAIKAGQKTIQVHAFPFRMTDSNLARHVKSPWYPFWSMLKEGYDHFETTRIPAEVAVCERKYVVNVKLPQSRLDPERACPQFERPVVEPFIPKPTDQQIASERIVSPGPKTRDIASSVSPSGAFQFPALGSGSGTTGSGSPSAFGFSQ
jgi:murein L,D-transpeptidase YafK